MFFDREYVFKGKHAKYVNELKENIFNRNIDVFILAPVLGLVYNRKSFVDRDSEFVGLTTKIFAEQMNSENEKILFNYRLCMLLNEDKNKEEKVDNAFRYYTEDEKDENNQKRFESNIEEYNSYILGGVEVLYERLLANGKVSTKEDVLKTVTEFIADYIDDINDLSQDSDEW